MELSTKKIYCNHCKTLVRCSDKVVEGETNILCSKCGLTIRLLDRSSTWKYVPKTA